MRCLLDVNILIALLDANHVFHGRVHDWLGAHKCGLASCAITQNAAIRIMSQPRYSSLIALTAAQVRQQLQIGLGGQDHTYWACEPSLLDDKLFDWSHIHGPAQLTDIYLLGLALRHKACLVTLDRNISINTVRGAKAQNLLVL